jgi:hypothetical protein
MKNLPLSFHDKYDSLIEELEQLEQDYFAVSFLGGFILEFKRYSLKRQIKKMQVIQYGREL